MVSSAIHVHRCQRSQQISHKCWLVCGMSCESFKFVVSLKIPNSVMPSQSIHYSDSNTLLMFAPLGPQVVQDGTRTESRNTLKCMLITSLPSSPASPGTHTGWVTKLLQMPSLQQLHMVRTTGHDGHHDPDCVNAFSHICCQGHREDFQLRGRTSFRFG